MKKILTLFTILLSVLTLYPQERTCGTMEHLNYLKSTDPQIRERMQKNEIKIAKWIKENVNNLNKSSNIITIPVVVHVVWNTNSENISDNQVLSQITILNEDFRRLNADASNTPAAFQAVAADSEIEFCLATIDPNGNSTTGITRTQTSQSSFSTNDGVKFSSSGGVDAWNTSQYLNIWVCDLGNSLLGYAQFPGGNSSTDGVVCHYNYFGNTGTATYPYNLGRTATHEVGHYLNLRHIWGDSYCGNDYCNDTPTQEGSNGGCPNFPSTSNCTGNGSNGDMFMNYMDYTYDACMNMFSQDQKTRMLAAINTSRPGLLNNGVCSGTIDIYGCTDASANNYDPNATVDDGSCCYTDPLTITITTDDYPAETSWSLLDENGNIIQSISSGTLTQTNSTYSWDVCIDASECYEFIIYDTYGDGICCSYGNGSYNLSYQGSSIASGGSFSSSETVTGIGSCIIDIVGCMNNNASNYDPNATTDVAFGGITDPNVGTGAYFTGNQHLILDCNQESKIVSAEVYTQNANTVTFELRDSGGNVIDDTTHTLIAGSQRIDLNFDVPVGVDYQLGVSASNSGLWRNNGGVNYPYDIGGLINIKYSSAGSNPYGFYYFYYDIEVEVVCTGIVTTIYGCTDSQANNYDPNANTDDGSCTYDIYGCTNPVACNYDPLADTDDGSCVYADTSYTNVTACDLYVWNGVLYNTSGTYSILISTGQNCDSVAILNLTINYFNTSNDTVTVCDSYIWNGIVYTNSGYYTAGPFVNSSGCDSVATLILTILQLGCTDPLANNYDPNAVCDDGSCTYTPTSCPELAPTGLYASGVIQNRATINWDNMNDSVTGCVVDQYRIKYRIVGTSSWTQKTMGQPVGSCLWACNKTDKLILNLTPSSTYEYQMKAWYCGGGASSWSALETFTTADDCPNVGNFTVTTPLPNRATFTWDDSNGAYSFMRIKARIDNTGAAWFNVGGAGVAYGTFTKNKNGLTPGESYRGQARTWCDPNGGAYKSPTWTSLLFWTQPTSRIEVGTAITNLDVYPNPSRDIFNISFTSEEVQDLKIRVLNVIGEEIIVDKMQKFVGEYVKSIDLNNYNKGIYLLEIETNNGIINKKLILQ